MTPGMVEYVALRVARRFLFTDRFLLRFGRLVPYYRANSNQVDADAVVDAYRRHCARAGIPQTGNRLILEVGSGATNAVGYALAKAGWAGSEGRILLLEPFVALDEVADARMRTSASPTDLARVQRVRSLDALPNASVDIVLSNSVLEHVGDPASLIRDLGRVLSPSGVMLHAVDYRDHFFKYPYHFLLFSRATWDRWLNPGDLPRWRLTDHIRHFRDHGFHVDVLESESMEDEFRPLAGKLSREFDAHDPGVAVTKAVLAVRRRA